MHNKFEQITNPESIKLIIGHMVSFVNDEVEFFRQMAQMKIQHKLRANMSISNYGAGMTSTEKEQMSIAAETAFCRMVGLLDPTEEEIINNRAFDFKLYGKTIDVKSTLAMNPRLSISTGRLYKNYADIFVLIRQQTVHNFIFIGCAYKENLILPERISRPVGFRNDVYITNKLHNLELKNV